MAIRDTVRFEVYRASSNFIIWAGSSSTSTTTRNGASPSADMIIPDAISFLEAGEDGVPAVVVAVDPDLESPSVWMFLSSTTPHTPFAQQAARAVTPNVLRMYGRASDPFVRDTYTALDVIKDAMPFLRHNLPIRHDMFGRIMYIEQYGEPGFLGEGVANDVMEVIGSITRRYSIKDDPFAKELVKMQYAHSRPSRKMSLQGFDGTRVELNLEQYFYICTKHVHVHHILSV